MAIIGPCIFKSNISTFIRFKIDHFGIVRKGRLGLFIYIGIEKFFIDRKLVAHTECNSNAEPL